jgi:hypothetical protein
LIIYIIDIYILAMVESKGITLDKSWFIKSRRGNIKDDYFFEKKLGSGGNGAVYLASNKQTGKNKYFQSDLYY